MLAASRIDNGGCSPFAVAERNHPSDVAGVRSHSGCVVEKSPFRCGWR